MNNFYAVIIKRLIKTNYQKGFSLLEIMVALTILSLGILPISNLMSQSRTAMSRSEHEMKAVVMSSTLMDSFFRLDSEIFVRIPSTMMSDTQMRNYGLTVPADEWVKLEAQVRAVNLPNYPADRFVNPYGRVFEVSILAYSKQPNNRFYNKPITIIKDYRRVE